MDDLPLLGIGPDVPQKFLSEEARRRIQQIRPDSESLIWEAESTIDGRGCVWQEHLAHFGGLIWPTLSY